MKRSPPSGRFAVHTKGWQGALLAAYLLVAQSLMVVHLAEGPEHHGYQFHQGHHWHQTHHGHHSHHWHPSDHGPHQETTGECETCQIIERVAPPDVAINSDQGRVFNGVVVKQNPDIPLLAMPFYGRPQSRAPPPEVL